MPIHLLYVGGQPHDADLTRAHLERDGSDFRVEIVPTGTRGLARIAAKSFDLLLLDGPWSDMDGIAMLAHLRAAGQTPPVVMALSPLVIVR